MIDATLRLWDGYSHTSPQLRSVVTEMQRRLHGHGFGTDIDGYFGRDTEDDVKRFQSANSLVIDGVVGPKTWRAFAGADPPEIEMYQTTIAFHDTEMLKQLGEARKYADYIKWAAEDAGVHQSAIYGIGSRESRWGLALDKYGTGDYIERKRVTAHRTTSLPPDLKGYGRGLLQIDWDAHEFARGADWKDAAKNIAYGGMVLRDNIRLIRTRQHDVKGMGLLRAGIAAYNCGAGNVLKAIAKGHGIDYYTHSRNYSQDVLSRAGWFQLHGV